ncbi:MAG: hypothetical protein WCC08_05200, partial [Terrimicrobiaceae bacterium]
WALPDVSGDGEGHDRFGVVVEERGSRAVPQCTRTPSCRSPRWRNVNKALGVTLAILSASSC